MIDVEEISGSGFVALSPPIKGMVSTSILGSIGLGICSREPLGMETKEGVEVEVDKGISLFPFIGPGLITLVEPASPIGSSGAGAAKSCAY